MPTRRAARGDASRVLRRRRLVIGLAALERAGRDHLLVRPAAVDDAVEAVGPERLATLIYTSGTTGRPKGVRPVHDSWTYEARAIQLDSLHDEPSVWATG